jgi:hypothetical protein
MKSNPFWFSSIQATVTLLPGVPPPTPFDRATDHPDDSTIKAKNRREARGWGFTTVWLAWVIRMFFVAGAGIRPLNALQVRSDKKYSPSPYM